MALSTARMHKVRGRPPLLAAGINSLIHSHSSSVRSLGYVFSFIYPFYTTHEDFSDRLSVPPAHGNTANNAWRRQDAPPGFRLRDAQGIRILLVYHAPLSRDQ